MGLREIRRAKNITQRQLADEIGVTHTMISKYENGKGIPPSDKLAKIATFLGVTIDTLINESTDLSLPLRRRVTVEKDPDTERYKVVASFAENSARIYADGHCELCNLPAPFITADGTPYLEVHHIDWLSDGGQPIPENTVVLCPNCHTKIHMLNDPSDIQKLKKVAKEHPSLDMVF